MSIDDVMGNGPDKECFICGRGGLRHSVDPDRGMTRVDCPRCGRYAICEALLVGEESAGLLELNKALVSGAIREASDRDRRFFVPILPDNLEAYLANAPGQFNIPAKARKLLAAISRRVKDPGVYTTLPSEGNEALAYAASSEEFEYVAKYLDSRGWAMKHGVAEENRDGYRLTPEGWEDVWRRPRHESPVGFVALWFSEEMTTPYDEAFKPAIEDCQYEARRIDQVHFLGGIVDKIMAEINEARFVVCDLTGQRQSVYFEAGYAMGLGVPVIWTCREDWGNKTAFDAKHLNQIRWKDHSELREAVATRIRAVIGMGPYEQPALGK